MYFKIAFNRFASCTSTLWSSCPFPSYTHFNGERQPAGLSAIIYFLIMTCLIIYFNSISPSSRAFPSLPYLCYIMFKQLLLLMMLNID